MLVAVYGTLKKNYGNHWFLRECKLLSSERLSGWTMVNLGAFPAVSPSENTRTIAVEVYEITEQNLEDLDNLEGYPYLYDRTEVQTSKGPAWLYFIDRAQSIYSNKLIETGEW